MSIFKLGMRIEKQKIEAVLAFEPGGDQRVVGLSFTPPELNQKKFTIQRVEFDESLGSFSDTDVTAELEPINFVSDNGFTGNWASVDPTHPNWPDSFYQFWNQKVGFVYFGKEQLKTLFYHSDFEGSNYIMFSGFLDTYGKGYYNYSLPTHADYYPTLKAEREVPSDNKFYEPNVIKGQPCPPYWGSKIFLMLSGIPDESPLEVFESWTEYAEVKTGVKAPYSVQNGKSK